jgi:hypothetical protein
MNEKPRKKFWYEESSLYQKWMNDVEVNTTQESILTVLRVRLGEVPEPVVGLVRGMTNLAQLQEALLHSVRCRTIANFCTRIGRMIQHWKQCVEIEQT